MDADLVVVGSGAAGLTAATAAAHSGARVVVLEATPFVGGTSAISGGMIWLPANHKMAAAGVTDSLDAARTYLAACVPPGGPGAMLETFLQQGDAALRWLEANTTLQLQPVPIYPDYYPDRPGATRGARVLEPVTFDARSLGRDFVRLRAPLPEYTLFGGMMIARPDIPHLRRVGRSVRSTWHVTKLLWRHARERMQAPRGTTLVLGNALIARLFKSALDARAEVRTGVGVQRLLHEEERIVGVALADGSEVRSARGVVLACGGISHDTQLRPAHVPPRVGTLSATVPAGDVPSGARLALDCGARFSDGTEQQGFWVPASTFRRKDGSAAVYPHTVVERAKPGLIAVDQRGRRFVNEALSYHEFVLGQLRADAVPAWLVCDRPFLWSYGLGRVLPFTLRVAQHVAAGYLHRGATPEELAASAGIDATGLAATLREFNIAARRGEDPAFGRGADIYQRHLGDADHRPNPCVAPIETPPYYAVRVEPADLGMAAGLVTDEHARALGAGGTPIPGLWACGNDMQSVMNGAYPGPGITLGPALVFGWIAGRDAQAR